MNQMIKKSILALLLAMATVSAFAQIPVQIPNTEGFVQKHPTHNTNTQLSGISVVSNIPVFVKLNGQIVSPLTETCFIVLNIWCMYVVDLVDINNQIVLSQNVNFNTRQIYPIENISPAYYIGDLPLIMSHHKYKEFLEILKREEWPKNWYPILSMGEIGRVHV